jgi:nucleoside-diphosphate-sugar epimerase
LVTTGQVRFFTENREFGFKKARRDFGYKPKVDFEEGVKRTIRWYKKKNLL